jgi:hypothetical protein
MDVDTSEITDEEAHILLSDINHHIARTSNPDNPFKFRVLLELDSVVDIPDDEWRFFISSVAEEISISVDVLPKAQIFFSFEGRKVYSTTDQEPLATKEHILKASNKVLETNKLSNSTTTIKKQLLDDSRTTFARAFDAKNGEGSRKMIWAARYAKELGATKKYVVDLMNEINQFWVNPLDAGRFKNTILTQIERWKW